MAGNETLTKDHHDIGAAMQALTGFINTNTLLDLAHRFSATYAGLAKSSTEHFLATPVTALPTGKEKGKFLSIDVGGTNLRVGFIELVGDLDQHAKDESDKDDCDNVFAKVKRSHDKNWPIGDHLKMDHAEDLFSWIGGCIAEVVREAIIEAPEGADADSLFGDELLLGITFSFPMAQTRLSEATLLPMGKGFAITSDLNLGKMLLAGYEHHRTGTSSESQTINGNKPIRLPRIKVAAITNDTVATFASLAYAAKAAPNSRVAMGLIVGTGTNATVPMKPAVLHPSKRKALPNADVVETVVINTEWTIRGTDRPLDELHIKTSWDDVLDANSDAPGFQPFEYMTAGRYLGEIVRLVFVDLVGQAGVELPPLLTQRNSLRTRFLSEVVARLDDDAVTQELEKRYPQGNSSFFWTPARVKLVRDIAYAVQQRSSALVAAACVGLLNCVHDIEIDLSKDSHASSNGIYPKDDSTVEELVIAYAGGTISQYPQWLETCQRWIDTLVQSASPLNASKRVVLREALDGGIIGAGVLAGMTDDMA